MKEFNINLHELSSKRKKDYITYLAVFLLTAVIVLEAAFAAWLPRRLRSEKAWEREALIVEILELCDVLRGGFSTFKTRNEKLSGEISQAQKCLEEYTKYFRDHKDDLTLEQAMEVRGIFAEFEKMFVHWKIGKSYCGEERLDTGPYLKSLLDGHLKKEAEREDGE